MYEVSGLSSPRTIIGRVDHSWKILRGSGEPGAQWVGDYQSPADALVALAKELGAEADVPILNAQPHDGIAQQDSDGRWNVYELDEFGVSVHKAGPLSSRSEAIDELKRIVPVESGDQFVVDAQGVVQVLN